MQLILTIMCKLRSKRFSPIDGFYVIRKFPCVIACVILRLSFFQLHISRLRTGLCMNRICANSTLLSGGCCVQSLAHQMAQTGRQNGM